ncbi:MAG: UvrD-helicase domain-containing protein [Myxococcota bacterium]
MTHTIAHEELELLQRVALHLEENPYDVPPSEADTVAELMRLRDELASAKEEDKAAIMTQYDHHFALLRQLRETRERPQVDPASPYFAHLRLSEDGKERDLCLGKATRVERGLRIVDWRNAPISRIFYSYRQGEIFEETFGERLMEGEVVARRTVTIRGGELHRIDAPEGTFVQGPDGALVLRSSLTPKLSGGMGASETQLHEVGDGMGRRFGRDGRARDLRSDKRLPDIAGLIDPEQFDLITRPGQGFLVVRGPAGSGKTTVALHRIAYLAFGDRGIDSPRTLFLVFSRALRDYVGRVLPALGLNRVHPMTFPEWAHEQRKRHFPKLPRKTRDDTPAVVLRLKTHPATMIALERQVELVSGPSTMAQAIDDWASVLTEERNLREVLAEVAPDAFSEAELSKAFTWNRDRYNELVERLDGDRDVVAQLDPEDDALLLRAFQVRVGPLRFKGQRPLTYRHICIDEVQDFSPIEVRVLLGTLDRHKSITLAGDTQQHVTSSSGFTSWSAFFGWLGLEGAALETLSVAYRSARPIVEFAVALLGDNAEDEAPRTVRDGPPVELFRFTDHGQTVAFLGDVLKDLARDEPLASVAVIVPDRGMALLYEQGLKRSEVPRLRRVVDEEFSFSPGVEIVEVRDVKGLEFDYVVIVEASYRYYGNSPSARRLLHVAATRAIHQLWVTSVDEPSPVVKAAMEQTKA